MVHSNVFSETKEKKYSNVSKFANEKHVNLALILFLFHFSKSNISCDLRRVVLKW